MLGERLLDEPVFAVDVGVGHDVLLHDDKLWLGVAVVKPCYAAVLGNLDANTQFA